MSDVWTIFYWCRSGDKMLGVVFASGDVACGIRRQTSTGTGVGGVSLGVGNECSDGLRPKCSMVVYS